MDMHALIDASGVITDVVLWDGNAPDGKGGWSPPAGTTAVLIPTGSGAGKGWSYDAKAEIFTSPSSAAAPAFTGSRTAPGPTLVKALTDAQWDAIKGRDQGCISGRSSIAENNDMIARAAAKAGTTPKAWFDIALGVTPPTT